MKIGYTGWTWLSDEYNDWAPMSDNHKRDFEQYLREVADLGYETTENFNFIADYYKDDWEGFKAVVAKYGLKFANLYFYFSDDPEKDVAEAERYLEFMTAVGATHMNMQGVMWKDTPFDRPTDEAGVKAYASLSNRIGKLCAERGIKACLHPHANTKIFKEDQIDLFLANTDPSLVWLCLDTAHLTLAGMDAALMAKKYGKRVGYMHLKDIDPDESLHPEWPMKRFRPLGQGIVNFRGVYNALKSEGYDDILCVELDYQPVCNYKSAMDSRNYIHSVLGL